MLENRYSFDSDNENDYNPELRKCETWEHSKKRILIVCQSLDGRDIKTRTLFCSPMTEKVLKNSIKYTRGLVRAYNDPSAGGAFATINYNNKKHLHLPSGPQKAAEAEFANRVHRAIRKLKPTHIFVSGDVAMNNLFPSIVSPERKRGWVYDMKINGEKVKVTSSLDLARLIEKGGEYANLLGYWCMHLRNLMLGKHPHSLKGLEPTPRYVDTIEKFDKVMRIIRNSKIVAVDTEDANLSVLHNKLYTVQFTTEKDPTVGYVIPVNHPMTPWAPDELKHVRKELKKWLSLKPGQKGFPEETIYMNGMFDLRVFRQIFKLPIIWHRVWEITAGEHDLDENIKEVENFKAPMGNLDNILHSYECDYYANAKFGKGDRNNIAGINPSDKNFLKYAAMDTVSLFHIRQMQLARASYEEINGKNYKPYFKRHVLYQMSDTVHQLSHLQEDGSLIDVKYLRHLIGPDSPLRMEAAKLMNQLKRASKVQAANALLLKNAGVKSKSLMSIGKKDAGANASNWMLAWTKAVHLRVLFFEVLGLEPVNYTPQKEPSVDKAFVNENKMKHPIVADYGQLTGLKKLIGTYAKGWYKRITTSIDSLKDNHLRAAYSFWDVATGRLASKNPNLQNIPSRSKLTKIIKRMFVAPKGRMLVRFDYSAHEVRVWSIVSGDKVLASAFGIGQSLRKVFIKDPSEANAAEIKLRGDIHIANVRRLFNKQVDKKHPLRDAVKAVIFGLLYGKSAETLGEDTKTGDIQAIKSKMEVLYAELDALDAKEGVAA